MLLTFSTPLNETFDRASWAFEIEEGDPALMLRSLKAVASQETLR